MTAIVAGQGLGLTNTSLALLGGQGQLSAAEQGRAGEKVVVNAATGNLVVQQQDEWLVGIGPDVGLSRTYNSLASGDDDNGDNWRLGFSRKVAATGTFNIDGHTVTRTDEDGRESIYVYDRIRGGYINKDGAGGYDILKWDNSSTWTWIDGDTQVKETYKLLNSVAGDYRLQTVEDVDANKLTLSYDATNRVVTKVQTNGGEYVEIEYDTAGGKPKNIKSITSNYTADGSAAIRAKRVSYTYDANNRLASVTVDLTPANAGDTATAGTTYVTSYTYDDAVTAGTKRLKTLTQTDGSKLEFEYDAANGYKVKTVKEHLSPTDIRTTQFTYGSNTTTITDPLLQTTVLTFVDPATYSGSVPKAGQLLSITTPAVNSVTQTTSYTYDDNGNVLTVTDPRGKVTAYKYDANGNRAYERNAEGSVTERTFGSANQVLTQTVYTGADTDGYGTVNLATGGLTTRYIYDAKNHLRFVLSPEGRVTEHQYNGQGQRTSTLQYNDTYSSAGLASWNQDFGTNTAGLSPATLPSVFARNATDGTLVATSTNQTTATTAMITTPVAALGSSWSVDIKTGSSIGKEQLFIGVENNAWNTGNFRRQALSFSYNQVTLDTWIGTQGSTRNLGGVLPNTTYTLRINTHSDGTSELYLYVKGTEPSSGYSDLRNLGPWDESAVNNKAWMVVKSFSGPGAAVAATAGSTTTMTLDNFLSQLQPGVNELGAWADARPAKASRTDYTYDTLRGQLASQTTFTATDTTTGAGKLDGTQSRTLYVYDSNGRLLQAIDGRGDELATQDTVWAKAERLSRGWRETIGSTPFTATEQATLRGYYTTTYAYDGLGRLLTQKDGLGKITTTAYADASLTTTVTLANGLASVNTYDKAGRLLSVERRDSTNSNAPLGTTYYTYDKLNRLVAVKLPATGSGDTGQSSYIVYDAAGRKVADIDAEGALTEYSYNKDNQLTRSTRYANLVDPAKLTNGGVGLSLEGSLGVRPATNAFDRISYNIYDQAGRLVKTVDPAGAVVEYRYDGASRLTDTLAYNAKLDSTVLPLLKASTAELTATNGTLSYSTSSGSTQVTQNTANATNRRTRNFYSADGLLIGQLDAENYYTQNSYDSASRLIKVTRYATAIVGTVPEGNTPPTPVAQTANVAETGQDQVTKYFYNARNQLTGVVDAELYYTAITYDAAGNKASETRYKEPVSDTYTGSAAPTSHAEDQKTLYRYDANNRLLSTQQLPTGLLITNVYDEVGNLTKTTTLVKATGQTDYSRVQQRRYDKLGRVIAELSGEGSKALTALGSSPTQAAIDAVWNTYGTRYTYDNAGRRIATIESNGTDATGNQSVHYYDKTGRLTHSLNALGEITEYVYNAFGDQTELRRYAQRYSGVGTLTGGLKTALGTAISSLRLASFDSVVSSDYNVEGRLLSQGTSTSDTKTYYYNAFGNVGSIDFYTSAGYRGTTYLYDRRGLQKQQQLVNDSWQPLRTAQTRYDAFGRAVRITDDKGNATVSKYDRLGRTVTAYANGSTKTGQTTEYDAFGRVLYQYDQDQLESTSYSYDSANRTVTITLPDGKFSVTTQDSLGQTVKVTDERENVTKYSYNADGQLLNTYVFAKGSSTALTEEVNIYDKAGRLTLARDEKFTYTALSYDKAGRVLTRNVGGLATQYLYDAKGQAAWVKKPNGVWTKTEFNLRGEVVAVVVDPTDIPDLTVTTPLPDGSQALKANPAAGGGLALRTEYSLDTDGQTLQVTEGAGTPQAKVTKYTYNLLGQRTEEIVDPTGLALKTSYTYDGNGNVVAKVNPELQVTRYVYDKGNRLSHEVDATGAVTRYEYDTHGRLTRTTAYAKQIDLTGLANAITASTVTTLLGAANPAADRVSHNIYNLNGRLSLTVDALGYATRYTYDEVGNVRTVTRYATAVTMAAGVVTEDRIYFNAPTVTTSAFDQVTQTVYDGANRVITQVDAEGGVTYTDYSANNQVITQRKTYNKVVYPTGKTRLDSNVKPDLVAGAPNPVNNAYVIQDDARDQVTSTELDGAGRVQYVQDANLYWTEYVYDGLSNVTSVIRYNVPDDWQGSNNVTTAYVYDRAGRQTDKTEASGSAEASTTKTAYDAVGRITDVTAAFNKTADASQTHYVYDKAGRQTEVTQGYNSSDATTTKTVYDKAGRITDITVASGTSDASTTHYVLDAEGRVTNEYKAYSTTVQAITRYVLDAFGQRSKVIDPRGLEAAEGTSAWAQTTRQAIIGTTAAPNKITNATNYQKLLDAFTTTQTFDKLGHVTKTSSVLNLSDIYATAKVEIKTDYDGFGNAVKVTDPNGNAGYFYFDRLNQNALQVDPMGYATKTVYNRLGQVEKVIKYVNAVNNQAALTTAVQPTVYTQAELNAYKAANGNQAPTNAYWVSNPDATSGDQTTSIEHDKLGRQTKITDALGFFESMIYDGLGNKRTYTNKLGGIYTYTYYKTGLLKTEKLPEQAYAYDTSTGEPTGALQDVINYYEYDARGNRTKSIEAQGLMPRTTTYTYDKLDRQITKTGEAAIFYTTAAGTSASAVAPVETRHYDKRGNVIEVIDANGARTLTYWDALDRKTAEVKEQYLGTDSKRYGVLTACDYNKSGDLVTQRMYAQAIEVTAAIGGARPAAAEVLTGVTVRTINYTFDANHRQLTQTIVGNGNLLVGEVNPVTGNYEVRTQDLVSSKQYDAAGNVVKDIDARGNATWHYYDKLGNRILQVDAERYAIEWAYDAGGNVKTENKYALKLSEAVVLGAPTSTADVIATAVRGNPQDRKTEFERDKLGRVKTQTLYNVESATVNATTGALTHSTTALAQTKYEYNGLNHVTKKTEAGTDTEVTDWTYDKLGRETKKQGAKFKDYTATADEVRQTTGTEYNALGLTARTTEHGKVTADDRYTRYFYGANGVLLSEQKELNATQKAITRYQHDAAGQVTSQRSDRINTAATATSTDLTTFTYDLAGRQVKQTLYNLSGSDATLVNNVTYTALQTQESKYDVYGSIVNKRTYGDTAPAATAWQEFAEYDVAGHLSKTNSGDGVTKAYVYDANGNATLKLTSAGADLKATAINQLLGAADVQHTASLFDKRNQLKESTEGLSPQTGHSVRRLESAALDTASAIKIALGSTGTYATSASSALSAGVSSAYKAQTGYISASAYVDEYGASGDETYLYLNMQLPEDPRYGADALTKITVNHVYHNYYGGYYPSSNGPQTSYHQAGVRNIGLGGYYIGDEDTGGSASFAITIEKVTNSGNHVIGTYSFTADAYAIGSEWVDMFGWTPMQDTPPLAYHFNSQPINANRLELSYRSTETPNGAWTQVSATQGMAGGKVVPGWFIADQWTNVPRGSYDIRYVALDAAGHVLNSQTGTMTLSDTAPTITQQSTQATVSSGRAFLDTTGNINLTELGKDAKSAQVKFREVGTSAWTNPSALLPASIGGAPTPGWFKFVPGSLSPALSLNKNYEYIVTTFDSGSKTLAKASGSLTMASATTGTVANALTSAADWASTVHFQNLPKDAVTARVLYRTTSTSGTRLEQALELSSPGSFDWPTFESVVINPASTYALDYEIQAFDAQGQLLHDSTGKVKVGATNELVVNSTASATPAAGSVVIKPQVAAGSAPTSVKVYYRAAGSTGSYSAPVTISMATEGLFTFNATSLLPSSTASGQWDYYYEAFAGTTKLSDSRQPTLANPGRLSLGTAALPAPQSVLLGVANSAQVSSTSQTVNAFGDVIEQVDALGRITTLRYNSQGKLIEKLDPITEIVDANGTTRTGDARRPSTKYFYDLQGRLVGTEDANGNRITQLLLEAGEGQAIVKKEFHADGGIKRNGYDVFGDLRYSADEMSLSDTDATYRTLYEYDKAHRLVKLTRPTRTNYSVAGFDLYTYDQAGNRIKHQTSTDGSISGVNFFTDTTSFDALGRATRTDSAANRWMTYNYVYDTTIKGVNEATVGGWKVTTTNSNTTNNVLVDYSDMFGHKTRHIDLSGRDFTYRYNVAGWLVNQSRTDSAGQNIDYAYYADGRIKSLTDKAANTYTLYEYDRAGNKTYEGYATSNSTGTSWNFYQQATIAYDELNRVKSVVDPQYRIEYQYDAVGNRRHLKAFKGSSTTATQDYWYSYDSMNRFSVTMGKLKTVNSVTSIYEGTTGDDGVYVIYDKVGRRTQVNVARDGHREDYDYSTDGFLTNSYLSASTASKGNKVSERQADLLGRVSNYTEYEANGTTVKAATSHAYTYDADGKVKTDVNNGTTTTYVMFNDGTLKETHSVNGTYTADTYYAYQWWDDAKQLAITTQEYNPSINKDLNKWKPGTSFFNYDVNGHASSVEDVVGKRSLRYATNAQGLILVRDEIANATVNKTQNFFYFDGARIGEVGNDATARNVDYAQALASQPTDRKTAYKNFRPIATSDFDQNYTPISPTYPGFTSAGYTAQGGEKLQDVAQAVWGDASLWYLLADANGLTSTTPLVAGQVLVVPNKVTNIHNNSTTKAVYNAAEAMGDTSPTLPDAPPPPKPKKGCGGIGQILMVVVAVVATAMTGFLLGPALLTALGPVMATIASAAVAGAVGSIASQVVGLVTGDVKKFSWSSVATSAISAAVTAGVGGAVGAANTLAGAMASAAVSNVATQGVLMAVGLQKKFSWTAVAASAAGAGASFGAGELLQGAGVNIGPNGSFGEKLVAGTVKGMAGGWAGAMARHEKPDWSAIAAQSFGSALGDAVVGSITKGDGQKAPQKQEPEYQSKPLTQADIDGFLSGLDDIPVANPSPGAIRDSKGMTFSENAKYRGALRSQGIDPDAPVTDAPLTQGIQGKYVKVKSGDTVSGLMGSSSPQAVGAFLAGNDMTNSNLRAGQLVFVPDDVNAFGSQARLGQSTLNSDNRRSALSAEASTTTAQQQAGWDALQVGAWSGRAGDGVPVFHNGAAPISGLRVAADSRPSQVVAAALGGEFAGLDYTLPADVASGSAGPANKVAQPIAGFLTGNHEIKAGFAVYAGAGFNAEITLQTNLTNLRSTSVSEFEAGLGFGVGFKGLLSVRPLDEKGFAANLPVGAYDTFGSGQANRTGAISTKAGVEMALPFVTLVGAEAKVGLQSSLNGAAKVPAGFVDGKLMEVKLSPALQVGASAKWDVFNTSYKYAPRK
ncbi:MAG: RHS repeat protein [Rubrivivax sp.]|nr:MAG: RHS repeat protein [Rubrivivax sp.]